MPSFGRSVAVTVLRCPFHFLEGKHLDLPHALARDAEFIGEHSKRDRVFGEAPRLEDTALAIVEARQGLGQRLAPIFQIFVLDQDALLARRVIDQPILPFAGFAFLADRRIERGVAAEPTVHAEKQSSGLLVPNTPK